MQTRANPHSVIMGAEHSNENGNRKGNSVSYGYDIVVGKKQPQQYVVVSDASAGTGRPIKFQTIKTTTASDGTVIQEPVCIKFKW